MLVIDPKGENARRTAARRLAMGQHVYVVDPWAIAADADRYGPGVDPTLIARYNPLDALKADDPDLATDAMMLADALVVPSGGDSRFWDDEARALIMGFLMYLATDYREKATRNLGRLRDILTLPWNTPEGQHSESLQVILVQMATSENPLVRSAAARLSQKDEKERSAVISSAQSNTHFLDSPVLRRNLEGSDFAFTDLKTGDRLVTVYLVLPLDRLPTFNRWLRLLVIAGLKDLMRLPFEESRPQVRIILDEFAALDRLDMVEKAYGTMAGLGVQLCAIAQDLAQMERLYGKSWQTFVSNAGVFQYFGSRDKMSAEYASSLCGMATVKKISRSFSFGSSHSSTSQVGGSSTTSGSNSGESFTADDVSRPLIYPDELMTLPRDKQVVFVENRYPIACDKIEWFSDPTLQALQSGTPVPPRKIKQLPNLLASKKLTTAAKPTGSYVTPEEARKNEEALNKVAAEQRQKQRDEVKQTAKAAIASVKTLGQKLTEGQRKMKEAIEEREAQDAVADDIERSMEEAFAPSDDKSTSKSDPKE
jgi:type IV secretion system protein VirD4